MDRQVRNNLDRISNLPENITEIILARLPIRDAVRTSILSRYWRSKWTTLPDLVFDVKGMVNNSALSPVPGSQVVLDGDKLVKVIHRILSQHKGPIKKFSLSARGMTGTYADIDAWISFLSRNGIRRFILKLNGGNWLPYKIHSSLFSCVNLWLLSLGGCELPSPPTFNGFNDLTCLRLSYVSMNNEGFENLIAKCLNLNTLYLISIDGLDRLNITYAPKLETLMFACKFKNICIDNTPNLLYSICFSRLPDMNQKVGNGTSISFINNLYGLSKIKTFFSGSYFLKVMFEDIDSSSSVIDLITRSPNLTKLVMGTLCSATNSEAGERLKTAAEYLEGKSRSVGCLMKLREVEMKDFAGVGPEMELIKLILGKSPSLEQMKIAPKETVDGFRQ
ncbi:hypothetical protein DITRI_Ditri12bG0017900 [Diplodiscus trichospermus]